MCYLPYPVCIGRKHRKIPKLNRPLVVIFNTFLCNYKIKDNKIDIEKAKINFLQQVFRLFYKDSLGFSVDSFFKNGLLCEIQKGDFVRLVCHSTKSIIRKLLLKLNYEIDDYKLLKRRKYTLIFIFYVSHTDNSLNKLTKNKNVTLDIITQIHDTFQFFITLGDFYANDLMQFLFYYYDNNHNNNNKNFNNHNK